MQSEVISDCSVPSGRGQAQITLGTGIERCDCAARDGEIQTRSGDTDGEDADGRTLLEDGRQARMALEMAGTNQYNDHRCIAVGTLVTPNRALYLAASVDERFQPLGDLTDRFVVESNI